MAEQAGQLVGKLLDLSAELASVPQGVHDVDITAGTGRAACHGPEELELGDPVVVADGAIAASSNSIPGAIRMVQGYPGSASGRG